MCAFVYGLNDCDERVRKEAAVQIRKQTKCNPSCCSQKVVDGLTCALSDCDRGVRRAAERALESCGYEVRDCNKASCAPAAGRCGAAANNCAPAASAAMAPATSAPAYAPAASESVPAAPAPEGDVIPVPAPAPAGAEPEAYFPSRLKSQNKAKKSGLANLFGLR
ncbi:MAG: HEAT repeat domain-containing protein [Planctomycetaceae bacterium]|jgi:hypothetical protein|nr:MAG: HEAT repeat domain-containing protein [Planctomycetaceae bacterium]